MPYEDYSWLVEQRQMEYAGAGVGETPGIYERTVWGPDPRHEPGAVGYIPTREMMVDPSRAGVRRGVTPGGERIPGFRGGTPYSQFGAFVREHYGMDVSAFLQAPEQERVEQYYQTTGSPYYEEGPEAGLPRQAPRTPFEAGEFMFRTAEWARRRAMQDQAAEIAALQYAIGLSFQAPGSLAALQSPYIGQMAGAYRAREYDLPDYSLWMVPERWR